MTEKSLKHLSEILMAIELVEDFTNEITDFICSLILKSDIKLN